MEYYYELIMRNGSSFIVSTNEEGVCEFSVNGDDFLIETQSNEKGEILGFTFSAGKSLLSETEEWQAEAPRGFSVVSVEKATAKRIKELRNSKQVKQSMGIVETVESWRPYLVQEKARFQAHRGRINTPAGWLCA